MSSPRSPINMSYADVAANSSRQVMSHSSRRNSEETSDDSESYDYALNTEESEQYYTVKEDDKLRDHKDWKLWKKNAQVELSAIWKVVDGSYAQPASNDAVWKKTNAKAYKYLWKHLSRPLQLEFLRYDDAHPLWTALAAKYDVVDKFAVAQAWKDLNDARMSNYAEPGVFIEEIRQIIDKLAQLGETVERKKAIDQIAMNLPKEYKDVQKDLLTSESTPTWESLKSQLELEAKLLLKNGIIKSKPPGRALNVVHSDSKKKKWKSKQKKKLKCFNCHSFHIGGFKNCTKTLSPELQAMKDSFAAFQKLKDKGDEANSAEVVRKSMKFNTDSGATRHMIAAENKVTLIEPTSSEGQAIRVADGNELDVTQMGKLKATQTGTNDEVCLKDTLVVEGLKRNLLSVSQLCDDGQYVVFTSDGFYVVNETSQEIVLDGHREGNLYTWEANVDQANISEELFHRRTGHMNSKALREALNKGHIQGLTMDRKQRNSIKKLCEGCLFGKNRPVPFQKLSKRQLKAMFQEIVVDVFGPTQKASLNGSRYFLTIQCRATGYVLIYFLKKRSEVSRKIVEAITFIENQFDARVKNFRDDAGGEFMDEELQSFFRVKGIQVEHTQRGRHEENGKIERLNLIIMDKTRAMLFEAGLSLGFWEVMAEIAVYLHNRFSKTRVEKSPYQKVFNEAPDISHLRAPGCLCYAHIVKDTKRKKLDKQGDKGIFVGYSAGKDCRYYKVYSLKSKRVISHRMQDVVFDETVFPAKKKIAAQEQKVLNAISDAGNIAEHANKVSDIIPKTWQEALDGPDAAEWKEAMYAELEQLMKKKTWELVPRPAGRKVMGAKWVFDVKRDENGKLLKLKARLVAKGFTQIQGIHYTETYAPVPRYPAIRCTLSIVATLGLRGVHWDIKNAFLNGKMDEEVYMIQPPGLELDDTYACRLLQALYGTKQGARLFHEHAKGMMQKLGFTATEIDSCIFTKNLGDAEKVAILVLWVDDILLFTNNDKLRSVIWNVLNTEYEMKDMGEPSLFLGVALKRDYEKRQILLNQAHYVDSILEEFQMTNCKPQYTPLPSNYESLFGEPEEEFNPDLSEKYARVVGSLRWLETCTRPDISFAVGLLSRFLKHPEKKHWTAALHVLRYLKGTRDLGIRLGHADDDEANNDVIKVFADADFAGDKDDYASTSGVVVKLGCGPISWGSKKQKKYQGSDDDEHPSWLISDPDNEDPLSWHISQSTMEAEYMAANEGTKEVQYLAQVIDQLGHSINQRTLYCDNQSAIKYIKNAKFRSKSKYMMVKYNLVRSDVDDGTMEIIYCPTEDMLADVLTKGLGKDKHRDFCKRLGMKPLSLWGSVGGD